MTILQKHLLFIPICIVVFAGTVGLLVMVLWNWLVPTLFGIQEISYLQAVGLLILSKLLFGGIAGCHHGHGHCHSSRNRLRQHWECMTPEERERFLEAHKDVNDAPHADCDGR